MSGSVAKPLQGKDRERCSVWERCRNVAGSGIGALQRPRALQKLCRDRIGSVEASGIWERHRSVAGEGKGALQRLGALQERCRDGIWSIAASEIVAGALQGQDWER